MKGVIGIGSVDCLPLLTPARAKLWALLIIGKRIESRRSARVDEDWILVDIHKEIRIHVTQKCERSAC
jgi:hypothetical protein